MTSVIRFRSAALSRYGVRHILARKDSPARTKIWYTSALARQSPSPASHPSTNRSMKSHCS